MLPAGKVVIGVALASLAMAGCGGGDDTVDCDPIAATLVSRIDVAPSTSTLADGEAVQLIAVAYSCDGTQVAPSGFTWQSGDATTVSVSTSGMAVAVKNGGPVTVSATAQGKQGSARISVTPRAVASVRVVPATAIVALGRTSTLVAKAFDAQGGELPGRPVAWSSSNTGIVTVSPEGGAFTGAAVGGPATITATIDGVEGSAQITVVAAAVASIDVSPSVSTIPVGSTVQLQAVLRDDQGSVLNGRALLWSTSDPARATVSGSGLVTGVAPGGPVTIVVTSEGRGGSAQVTVSPLALRITTTSLPQGTAGTSYNQALAASGGVTPYLWSVSAGTLPPGTTLSSAGVLSGTPTTSGTFGFTVRVTDGTSVTATQVLTLQVSAGVMITTTSLPSAPTGAAFSQQLVATGGTTPYTWALVSGALPSGLSLSGSGLLSGTPTAAGSSTFTVQVTDAASATDTQALLLVVNSSLSITTTTLPQANIAEGYSQQLSATGGTSPYTWTVISGAPPDGLALSPDGVISGTPTAAGSQTFTVRATDAASQVATQVLTLNVIAPLGISTTTLPGAVSGAPYSQGLTASGGTTPYAWTISAGAIPEGLTLSSDGVLSGTPTSAGDFTFTVQVSDPGSRTASQVLSISVAAGPAARIVWLRQPPEVRVNEAISPAPSVRVEDAAGNPVTAAIPVTMSITRPGGRVFAASSVTTVSTAGGIATFTELRFSDDNNSVRLQASAGSIRSPESNNFRVRK